MRLKRKYPFGHQPILREGEPIPKDHWMSPEFEYWIEVEEQSDEMEQRARNDNGGVL